MGKEAQSIGDALRRFLRQEGLETPLNEHRLIAAWPEVVSKTVADRSKAVCIKGRVLHVQVTSAPLRESLVYNRRLLTDRLNAAVGAHVIDDITFH